jgi:hypothetical protein
MNDIHDKSYSQILSEMETLKLIKNMIIGLSTIQMTFVYYMFRVHGFNGEILAMFFLAMSFFTLPMIIETFINKINRIEMYGLKKYIYDSH